MLRQMSWGVVVGCSMLLAVGACESSSSPSAVDAGFETGSFETGTTDTGGPDVSAPDTSVEDAAPEAGPDAFDAGFCLPSAPNLVSWWTGDSVFTDHQGVNPGAQVGAVSFVAGKVGQGFLTSVGNYVEVPDSASLDVSSAITIEAWINITNAGSTGRIVDKITAGLGDGYLLDIVGGKLRFLVGDDAHRLDSPADVPVGTFVHVAGAYDGINMKVYVAGAEVATLAVTGAIPTNALTLRLGADSNTANAFDGVIDEASLYSRALTAVEIAAISNAGAFGRCK